MTPAKPAFSDALQDPGSLKTFIDGAYHQDETAALDGLLPRAALPPEARARAKAAARKMVETVRANRKTFGGLDRFLNEFGLTTSEGIALMCLAEALLRIPDTATADRLIRDKIGGADWDKHLGKADDLFVNASTWALMLTGKVVGDVEESKETSISAALGRIVSRLGEPVVRQAMLQAMKILGQQFVMGRTISEALARGDALEKEGYTCSYDMLGEGARTAEDAERYFDSYAAAIDAIGAAAKGRGPLASPGISVKLSALHPRYEHAKAADCVPALSDKLLALAQKCARHNIAMTVDAEESHRLLLSLEIVEAVLSNPSLAGWEGFGLAVQAYQKRCARLIEYLAALCEAKNRRIMVRLVKGAYWDSEVKYAQAHGLPGYPVFTRKAATDVSYLACAALLMSRRDVFYPMFATHNAYTVAAVAEMAGGRGGFEFQRLHGMGEPLYAQVVGSDAGRHPCRIYAPVGSHQDLLPYLVRRLLENGANTNFVNRLQNDEVPVDEVLEDPVEKIEGLASRPHPKIPAPAALFPDRRNSAGVEFADTAAGAAMLARISSFAEKTWDATPLIAGRARIDTPPRAVTNPADRRRVVGTVREATREDLEEALRTTHAAFPSWRDTSADIRARCLERAADAMEWAMPELISLCAREAGKTLTDGVAEVREAVDFCRYYAAEGRRHFARGHKMPGPTGESNELFLEGRGTFLCISPWNFPLAIFMGQVTAALMAGNAVIAKPAGQTCLIAHRAVQILIEAGVPAEVLAFTPVSGRLAGEILVPDARIAGVCMTGSTETAQTINRALAARAGAIVPLIAETGGQNAMIVDSTALPEQVVDDAITSAFRSAGQRCSALRVLFLQEDIADKTIAMLRGACREMTLGDPGLLSTDIGPVIDQASLETLNAHAARMEKEGRLVAALDGTGPQTAHGTFFAPRAYEIESLATLGREVFGPILHILRFKAGEVDKVVDHINATGYGLTFGLHTRIDHAARTLTRRVNAGNCYVNRSMIGAVVGVQPFGGMGLSGTGPKAGGPHYLPRFATERTVTVNTTASGGNATLVSLAEE